MSTAGTSGSHMVSQLSRNTKKANCWEYVKTCPGKERRSSNYARNVGRLQEETNTQQAKKKEKLSKECHKGLG